jgi:hypothetical protein
MALTEETVLGPVTAQPSGHIEVRKDTLIKRDGEVIHTSYWRGVVEPGNYSKADALGVRAYADAAWTPELLAAYAATQQQETEL